MWCAQFLYSRICTSRAFKNTPLSRIDHALKDHMTNGINSQFGADIGHTSQTHGKSTRVAFAVTFVGESKYISIEFQKNYFEALSSIKKNWIKLFTLKLFVMTLNFQNEFKSDMLRIKQFSYHVVVPQKGSFRALLNSLTDTSLSRKPTFAAFSQRSVTEVTSTKRLIFKMTTALGLE